MVLSLKHLEISIERAVVQALSICQGLGIRCLVGRNEGIPVEKNVGK